MWILVDPPYGCKPIGLKWLYKIKRDAKGVITRHMARLVAKGYVQQLGIDFEEAFALGARMDTIRLILSYAAQMNWVVMHLDVKTAFLHGDLKETVFVKQPDGYVKEGSEQKVYRLVKALYGLRQAPRCWNLKLDGVLKELGFERCMHEQAVYVRNKGADIVILCVYVDDLLLTGNNKNEIELFKQEMTMKFEMTDMGLLCYYLGIEVIQNKEGIMLNQTAYAKKLLNVAGLKDCNETQVPMEPGLKLFKEEGRNDVDSTLYRKFGWITEISDSYKTRHQFCSGLC